MFTTFVLLLTSVVSVHGHGYLQTPRSRNYVASVDGKELGNGTPTDPAIEYEAPSLNVVGPQCGQVGFRNYDFPLSSTGTLLAPKIQANYTRGQTITVEVKITAHHQGHFEFYACAITAGQSPSQACFRANPLEFVEDLLYGSPKDVNYPYRAYMAPSAISSPKDNLFSYRMKLPVNVVGDLVLIQWWYLTGNSCDYEGYEQYNWPASWGNMDSSISKCIAPAYSGAEQFWNCAEVKIVDVGQPPTTQAPTPRTTTVAPTIIRTLAPTVKMTPAPVLATRQPTTTQAPRPPSTTASPTLKQTSAPTVKVTVAPVPTTAPTKAPAVVVGTCGSGLRGNGICPNASLCCSAWGYCGTGSPWCDTAAPVLATSQPTSTQAPRPPSTTASPTLKQTSAPTVKVTVVPVPTTAPTKVPAVVVGTCGSGLRGNGICPNASLCCSAWGYCGTGSPWCDTAAPVAAP